MVYTATCNIIDPHHTVCHAVKLNTGATKAAHQKSPYALADVKEHACHPSRQETDSTKAAICLLVWAEPYSDTEPGCCISSCSLRVRWFAAFLIPSPYRPHHGCHTYIVDVLTTSANWYFGLLKVASLMPRIPTWVNIPPCNF